MKWDGFEIPLKKKQDFDTYKLKVQPNFKCITRMVKIFKIERACNIKHEKNKINLQTHFIYIISTMFVWNIEIL